MPVRAGATGFHRRADGPSCGGGRAGGTGGTGSLRWIGHAPRAEADIVVDPGLTAVRAHAPAVAAGHALIHAVPRLTAGAVHTDTPPAAATRMPPWPTTRDHTARDVGTAVAAAA